MMSEKPAEAKAAKGDEAVTHLVPAGDKQTIEDTSDFPDPDEDDLDDLDGELIREQTWDAVPDRFKTCSTTSRPSS